MLYSPTEKTMLSFKIHHNIPGLLKNHSLCCSWLCQTVVIWYANRRRCDMLSLCYRIEWLLALKSPKFPVKKFWQKWKKKSFFMDMDGLWLPCLVHSFKKKSLKATFKEGFCVKIFTPSVRAFSLFISFLSFWSGVMVEGRHHQTDESPT